MKIVRFINHYLIKLNIFYFILELIRITIEIPCEILNNEKKIHIEKCDVEENNKLLGNINDLYNELSNIKDIHIKIPKNLFERGKLILIEKNQFLIINNDDYQNNKKHYLNNNQFARRDHLQSKSNLHFFYFLN